MMDYELVTMFPQTALLTSLGRDFTTAEMKEVAEQSKRIVGSEYNKTTENKYVLERKAFADLRERLLFAAEVYAFGALKYAPTFALKITQSWLNFAEAGEKHHGHCHQNSFLSGVLYIQTGNDEESSELVFGDDSYKAIRPELAEVNHYNANQCRVVVKQGDIVVFPSSLSHFVPEHKSRKTRISLAFNMFFTGAMGKTEDSTELII